jgi:hypothetical protein
VVWNAARPAQATTLPISDQVNTSSPIRAMFLGELNIGFTDGGHTLTAVAIVPDPQPAVVDMTVTTWRMPDLVRIAVRTQTNDAPA